ncbi:MAG: EscU/YscU/HrcU family type III secretion system export apparatus switch protein [Pseudomonadota bacterium]|nr:EscU/YscU/HrcU family type III secretion system export apparatus switch protein [Pseudomonadota bacterium]
MSEQAGEKTEQASDRQIEKFRKEGRVTTSRDLLGAASLSAGALGMVVAAPMLGNGILRLAYASFARAASPSLTDADVLAIIHGSLAAVAPGVAVTLVPAALVTTATGLLLSKFNLSTEAIEWKPERLDPIAGTKKLFSGQSFESLGKALFAGALVVWSAWSALSPWWAWLPVAPSWSVQAQAQVIADIARALLARAIPAAILLGVADYGLQWWRMDKEMKMTRQQVRDEHKESDGDPHVRAQRRRRARQLASGRQLADVPKADVVVVNPTHYAIALRYRKEENAAPVIVARGVDHLALQIKAAAMRVDIPIIENRALARALYAQGRAGSAIPRELYGPVAQVLAAVYRKRHRMS